MKKIVNENNKTNFYTGLAKRTAILSLTGAMVFSMAGGTFGTTSVNAATTCNVNSSTASVSVKNPSVFDTVTITAAKKAITKLTVIVNGTTLSKKAYKIKNTKNYSKNVIMVPLKAVAKELGMKVTKVSNGVYTLTTGSDESTITVGKDAYSYATTIDGACGATGIFTLGAAPAIKNKTLYVPASFIKCLYGNNDDLVSVSKNTISFHINDSEEDVSIPNPITTHATLADLSAAVGFTVKVPTAVVDSTTAVYDDISGTLAEVFYTYHDKKLLYRMGKGISDVSGDYNLFSSSKTITVGDLSVLLRGTDKGYSLATWNDGTYSYSVDITGATLSEDVFTSIITSIQ